MQVISVVCNFDMYNSLVRNNPYYGDNAEFTAFDNNKENKNITIRYNDFLKNFDYSKEEWFVFCHEDWELKENLLPKLENLDKNCLYGPIGVAYGKWYKPFTLIGSIIQSNKNGVLSSRIGRRIYFDNTVGTFDCQCLIVHSSLIKKYNLMFDENLSFDLYTEDFCITAREEYNLYSKVLSIKCQHYSNGMITEKFYEQLKYLQNKYKKVERIYYTIVRKKVIAGNYPLFRQRLDSFIERARPFTYKIVTFFYQKRITKSGRLLIKICKIPVYSKLDNRYLSVK